MSVVSCQLSVVGRRSSAVGGPSSFVVRRSSILISLSVLLVFSALAIFVAYQPASSYSIDISEPRSTAELEGVYLPERNDQFGPYRWTPAEITIHLRPIGGPLHVRVRLAGWRPTNSGNPAVTFTLGGHEVAEVPTSNNAQDVDLYITRGQALLSGTDLHLQTSTFKYGSDPRDLGVVLIGVQASSGAEWPRPAVPNGVVLWQTLLGALLLFGAGRAARLRYSTTLVGTCAAVLGMALLFAFDRQLYAQWTWIWLVLALLILAVGAYSHQLAHFATRCATAIRRGKLPEGNYELRVTSYEFAGAPASVGRPVASVSVRSARTTILSATLVIAALVIALLHPLIALLPRDTTDTTNFSWGFAYYAALPAWLGWGAILLLALFAIPPINRLCLSRLSSLITTGTRAIQNPKSKITNSYLLLAIAGLASVLFFRLLRTQTSKGDSSEILSKIATGSMWREREPLDYYIHFKLSWALSGLGVSPLQVYQWLSVLAGGLFVIAVVLVACLLAPPDRRWIVAGLGLATGNLLLFAGYVESYTLATLALVWFLFANLLYLKGSAPPAIPALILSIALWLHPMTIFLLPPLLAALLLKPGKWQAKAKDAGVMLATAIAVSLVVATIFLIEGYSWERWQIARSELGGVDPGLFKPLFQVSGPHEYYPIFSLAHLGGIVQEQLRLAPLALVICIILLLARPWKLDNGSAEPSSTENNGDIWRTPQLPLQSVPPVLPSTTGELPFNTLGRRSPIAGRPSSAIIITGIAALSTFLFSITWNPDLGPSSDWDLLSLPGVPLSLFAGALLAVSWPRRPATNPQVAPPYASMLRYCGSVLLAVAAWHALSWLLVNALALPY